MYSIIRFNPERRRRHSTRQRHTTVVLVINWFLTVSVYSIEILIFFNCCGDKTINLTI